MLDIVAATAWAAGLAAATQAALGTAPRGLISGAIARRGARVAAPSVTPPARRALSLRNLVRPVPPAGNWPLHGMSVLRNLEEKIAGLVEGTFGRVFRSEVRPVELARKLAKEMDEHRTVSVSRTYVPNEYVVWLSPQDRERYEGVEQSVIDELGAYLLEHARRERLALVSQPQIEFRTDERLALGEFGIQARLIEPHEPRAGRRSPPRGPPTWATRWSTRPRPATRTRWRTSAPAPASAAAARSSSSTASACSSRRRAR